MRSEPRRWGGVCAISSALIVATTLAASPNVVEVTGAVVATGGTPEEPVSHASVAISTEQGAVFARTDTDARGRFSIVLPPGRYIVAASGDGYLGGTLGADAPGEGGTTLVVGPRPLEPLRLRIWRPASVSGLVYRPNGLAGANVTVGLVRVADDAMVVTRHESVSDQYGRFHLREIPPGRYLVRTRPDRSASLPPVYAPGTSDPAAAGRVIAEAGTEVSGLVIRLPSEEPGSVRGVLFGPDGQPASGEWVRLETAELADLVEQTRTDSEGRFRLQGIRDGRYVLAAYRTRPLGELPGQQEIVASAEQTLEGRASAGTVVQLRMAPTPTVTLAVKSVPAAVLPTGARISFQRVDRPGPMLSVPVSAEPSPLRGAVAGRFRVSISPDASYWIRSVRVDGVDAAGPLVAVEQGPTVSIDIEISTSRAQLRGRVVTPEGLPHSESWITLVPAETERKFDGEPSLRVRPDTEGTYSFAAVPPGRYYLAAHRGNADWTSPEFIAQLKAAGVPVSLTAGHVAVQDIKVLAVGR